MGSVGKGAYYCVNKHLLSMSHVDLIIEE
ncbi:MAG: hypothetical protein RLZZ367_1173, partial [Bacteroidota bacterium]